MHGIPVLAKPGAGGFGRTTVYWEDPLEEGRCSREVGVVFVEFGGHLSD